MIPPTDTAEAIMRPRLASRFVHSPDPDVETPTCPDRIILVAFAVALLVAAGGTGRTAYAQADSFRGMSARDRAGWFESLGPALNRPVAPEPAAPDDARPASPFGGGAKPGALFDSGKWHHSRDGIKWSIDPDGMVVLDDGQRPTGSRLFARSCFLRYGDSFRRWSGSYGRGLGAAHLVATAITESGCSEEKGMSSVDGLSTGIMQVTGTTCQSLLRMLGRRDLGKNECMIKMAEDPDFSVELAAAYITQPRQVQITSLNPPKVAAAYNAGGVYFDPKNPWRMRSTGNHIDRFVAAYNAFVAWFREEGGMLDQVRQRRGAAGGHVRFTRGASLPERVETLGDLQALTPRAQEGATVFVGDWDTKRGDFYVYVDGEWQGSLDPSSQ
jgi:hypothetical protein